MKNTLYYGDNLEILRKYIKDESVDLCYIDPPFNSKRNYNQIYNNIGSEDRAQAQAFVDTWTWDDEAIRGYGEIIQNERGAYTPQTVALLTGLKAVLGNGSLLAYLVSMTQRIAEIHRVLKDTGSFYLHCDPTASHYLKLVCDTIFVAGGGVGSGQFRNEIIWAYRKWTVAQKQFAKNHDVIFFYTKSETNTFNQLFVPVSEGTMKRWKGKKQQAVFEDGVRKASTTEDGEAQTSLASWWEISIINPAARERLGYPTQKPEALLERIIAASTNEGDTVLDAYCGCGTTIAVSQRMNRRFIGMDITYQSIALILLRLQNQLNVEVVPDLTLFGIPRDRASAVALANKKDDRVRKEFEKWAVLTYTNNRAVINDKKGADGGIDGTAYFMTSPDASGKMVFQVKSGNVGRGDIAKMNSDRLREGAEMAVFITLNNPTAPMMQEAKDAGTYPHPMMGREYPRVQIVTIDEILMENRRMELPLAKDVLKAAKANINTGQGDLFGDMDGA